MRAKRNPQYDEMFLGGLVDRAKSFAEKRPGMTKAIGLGGGMLLNKAIGNKGAGLFSKMSGAGLMGMLRDRVQQRRNAEEVPKAELGRMIKKYRSGGMFYADQGDLLQTEKEKNKTSRNAELPGMDRVRAMALGDPRGGQAGQTSGAFFGAFPQEVEEEGRFSKSMRAIKGEPGSNMLPEVEIVGKREQPQEERKEFKLADVDPDEIVNVRGADGKIVEMTGAELNQSIIDRWNAENPDDQKEDIIKKEASEPLSDEYLYMKWLRAQGYPDRMKVYQDQPEVMRAIERGRIQVEDEQGGVFSDGTPVRSPGSSKVTFMQGLPIEAHYKPQFMYGSRD